MERKIVILLASTIALTLSWRFFDLFLSNDNIDIHPFYDPEYPRPVTWHVFLISGYVRELLMAYAFHLVVRRYIPSIKSLSLIIVLFVYVRLLTYWLFAGTYNLEVAVAFLIGFCAFTLLRWRS